MEIIAHRGASHDAPENTLAAVRLAWEQEADAVEVDVRLSSDGKLVVIHDSDTRRTKGVSFQVRSLSLDQLTRIDVGFWKGRHWSGETIPGLHSVLTTIPAGKRLFVEFKCGPEAIQEFKRAIKRSGKRPEQVVAIGFSISTMRLVKSALPELQVYWVTQLKPVISRRRRFAALCELIKTALESGLDGLDLRASPLINRGAVRQIRTAGLKLIVWTVDSPVMARRLKRAGVDGITTNRPEWLRERIPRTIVRALRR